MEVKNQEMEKEIIRLKTINNNMQKQLKLQEPTITEGTKDKFFKERLSEFLNLEELLSNDIEENSEQAH